MSWMESKATDRVDGGFAQDDCGGAGSGYGEVAEVFLRAGRHAAPARRRGATKLCADRPFLFYKQEKNGIASVIGIKPAGFDQGLDQRQGDGAIVDQVALDAGELAEILWR